MSNPENASADNQAPCQRRKLTPAARYSIRIGIGVVLYLIGLFVAIDLSEAGIGSWQPMLLTLPGVAVLAWAIVAFYRESDEFAQRQLGESFIIGFAIGVPLLLVVGLLEVFGGPHLNWMIAFSVMMGGWLIGSIVARIQYR